MTKREIREMWLDLKKREHLYGEDNPWIVWERNHIDKIKDAED